MANHYCKVLLALTVIERMLALQIYQPPPTTAMAALADKLHNLIQAVTVQAALLLLPYQVTLNCIKCLTIYIYCIVMFMYIWLYAHTVYSWLYKIFMLKVHINVLAILNCITRLHILLLLAIMYS